MCRKIFFIFPSRTTDPGFAPEKIHEMNEILSGKKQITKKNIGLYNVNRRIKVLFGEQFELQIVSGSGGEVIIRLPAEPYQNTELHGIEEERQEGFDKE